MLLHEILNEDATLPELRTNIEQGFPDTRRRQHITHQVSIANIKYTPLQSQRLIRIISQTNSNGNQYTQFIDLKDVEIQPQHSSTATVPITKALGGTVYVTAAPLSTNVGVGCSCQDYRMRFFQYNQSNQCHAGPRPEQYTRVTTDRPEVNPSHVPGMCKHIIKVVDVLTNKGIISRT
jgi:hypothetical protein